MVLNLSISERAEAGLREKAERAGVDVATYAARHLELIAVPPRSLIEISGPIATAVDQSGLGEDELADFLEEEKHQMRAQRRAKQSP